MKNEVAKMIRATACQKIGNHEYFLIKQQGIHALYKCKHCQEWWDTTPKTDEELRAISMKYKI